MRRNSDELFDERSSEYIRKSKVKQIGFIAVLVNVIVISVLLVLLNASNLGNGNVSVDGENQIDVEKLNMISQILNEEYYETVDMDDLNNGAVHGIVGGLSDPYSQYLTPEEYTEFTNSIENEYVGIGVGIQIVGDYVSITEVFQGSPAEDAGLISGDVFYSVDGEDAKDLDSTELANLVRGEEGTTVIIEVARGSFDNILEFSVVRGVIELPNLEYAKIDNTGYIKINTFSQNIYNEFRDAYENLETLGIDGLIIDVRNNSGGYLRGVTSIIDMFVDDSKPIYQEESRGVVIDKAYGDKDKVDIEVIVLTNGSSASASELLAAALKEINGSEVIGVSTYGKGVAQTQHMFSDSSFIKYTYAKWLTPNGNWIQDVGVTPTIELDENEELLYRNINIVNDLEFDTVELQNTNAQYILNILGYDLRTDGYYDSKMVDAVKDFQKGKGINQTGKIDSQTALALNEELASYKDDPQNDDLIKKALEVLENE